MVPASANDYTITVGANAVSKVVVKSLRADVIYLDNGVVHTLENETDHSSTVTGSSTIVVRSIKVYKEDPTQTFTNPSNFQSFSIRNVPDGFFAYATADGTFSMLPAPFALETIQSDNSNSILHVMSRNVSVNIVVSRNNAESTIRMITGQNEFYVDPEKDLVIRSLTAYPRLSDSQTDANESVVTAQLSLNELPDGVVAIIRADRSLSLLKSGAHMMENGTSDNPIVCVLTRYTALDIAAVVKSVNTTINCTVNDASTFKVNSDFTISSVFVY